MSPPRQLHLGAPNASTPTSKDAWPGTSAGDLLILPAAFVVVGDSEAGARARPLRELPETNASKGSRQRLIDLARNLTELQRRGLFRKKYAGTTAREPRLVPSTQSAFPSR